MYHREIKKSPENPKKSEGNKKNPKTINPKNYTEKSNSFLKSKNNSVHQNFFSKNPISPPKIWINMSGILLLDGASSSQVGALTVLRQPLLWEQLFLKQILNFIVRINIFLRTHKFTQRTSLSKAKLKLYCKSWYLFANTQTFLQEQNNSLAKLKTFL